MKQFGKFDPRDSKVKSVLGSKTQEEWDRLYISAGQLIYLGTDDYPKLLAKYDDAPLIRPMSGYASLLQSKGFAIIGASNASLKACKPAERYAGEIGDVGFTVILSMAHSFHAATNLSSMKTGTIAFLANGVGSPYPCKNIALFSRLIN